MPTVKMTAQDRKWQAEDDARTLAASIVIQDDPTRMKAATKAANRMAEEKRKDATAMSNVARKGTGSGGSSSKKNIRTKSGNLKKSVVKKAVKKAKKK